MAPSSSEIFVHVQLDPYYRVFSNKIIDVLFRKRYKFKNSMGSALTNVPSGLSTEVGMRRHD